VSCDGIVDGIVFDAGDGLTLTVDGGSGLAELVAGPVVFGSFVYKPQYCFGVFLGKWKRVGVSGPWIQEFGGVS
jgi:hypothetical protein